MSSASDATRGSTLWLSQQHVTHLDCLFVVWGIMPWANITSASLWDCSPIGGLDVADAAGEFVGDACESLPELLTGTHGDQRRDGGQGSGKSLVLHANSFLTHANQPCELLTRTTNAKSHIDAARPTGALAVTVSASGHQIWVRSSFDEDSVKTRARRRQLTECRLGPMRMWKMAAIAVATTVVLSCSTLHGSGFDPPGLLTYPASPSMSMVKRHRPQNIAVHYTQRTGVSLMTVQ